jgi:hypothetical protein
LQAEARVMFWKLIFKAKLHLSGTHVNDDGFVRQQQQQ